MYLLKQFVLIAVPCEILTFTFHHVSIKTVLGDTDRATEAAFTFHHVSIKTHISAFYCGICVLFTFHHVSIKTITAAAVNAHDNSIHIPPCIY